jgi:hypothetical protein
MSGPKKFIIGVSSNSARFFPARMRRKAGTGKKKQLYPANGKILI